MILDSGERTQFDSGAVRDMHDGKGRCDLLPMCVMLRLARHFEAGSKKYGDRNWEKGIPAHSFLDSALRHVFKYADGQTDEDHLIAAVWNLCCLAWTEEKKPDMMDIPARKQNESPKQYVLMNNGVKVGDCCTFPPQVGAACDPQAEPKNAEACRMDIEAYHRYIEGERGT